MPVPTSLLTTHALDVDLAVPLTVTVISLGLACCAVEVAAASFRRPPGPGAERPARAPCEVLVVAGTVTDKLAPAVLEAYSALAPPVRVIAFGACTATGGPYWDSYAVTKGVDQLIPVDLYVPGCPPRPEALVAALQRIAAGQTDL